MGAGGSPPIQFRPNDANWIKGGCGGFPPKINANNHPLNPPIKYFGWDDLGGGGTARSYVGNSQIIYLCTNALFLPGQALVWLSLTDLLHVLYLSNFNFAFDLKS